MLVFVFHCSVTMVFAGLLQSREEVMAVRLREADNIAAMAELQQQISELEIQVLVQLSVQLSRIILVLKTRLSQPWGQGPIRGPLK